MHSELKKILSSGMLMYKFHFKTFLYFNLIDRTDTCMDLNLQMLSQSNIQSVYYHKNINESSFSIRHLKSDSHNFQDQHPQETRGTGTSEIPLVVRHNPSDF